MNRREIVVGAGSILMILSGGCVSNPSRSEEKPDRHTQGVHPSDNKNISDYNLSENNYNMRCSFNVELVDDPPAEAPLVDAEKENLNDIPLFERIFKKSADPDKDHETVKRKSGEYETFSEYPESTDEYNESQEVLKSLPRYHNDDYPSGVYIQTNNITIVIAEQCIT